MINWPSCGSMNTLIAVKVCTLRMAVKVWQWLTDLSETNNKGQKDNKYAFGFLILISWKEKVNALLSRQLPVSTHL